MHAAATPTHSMTLGVATLLSWLFTATVGAYMLRRVAAHGGLGSSAPSAAACRHACSSGTSAWPCPAW